MTFDSTWGTFSTGRKILILCAAAASWLFCSPARADLWSTAYYPGYNQNSMVASNIDFGAVSHVIHFALVPNTDGSLNSSANGITGAHTSDLVTRAHAAGKKVLICVGGAGSGPGFEGATTNANLSTFVTNIVNFMSAGGYDGVDVDWEPFLAADATEYTNLVTRLRAALNGFTQYKFLTAAAPAYSDYHDAPTAEYPIFSSVQSNFDQINIMTYDLSGPYEGWVTWFNSPIYDDGYRFPSTGGLVPSVDGSVSNFIAAGVAPRKLGIGVAFYGYVWTGGSGTTPPGGVTLPRQAWTTNVPMGHYAVIFNDHQQLFPIQRLQLGHQRSGRLSQPHQQPRFHFIRQRADLSGQGQLRPQSRPGWHHGLGIDRGFLSRAIRQPARAIARNNQTIACHAGRDRDSTQRWEHRTKF